MLFLINVTLAVLMLHYYNDFNPKIVTQLSLNLFVFLQILIYLFTQQQYKMQASSSNEWVNWIEEAINKKHIKYYEYEYFHKIEEIGSGGFAKVCRANWRNSQKILALKSFHTFNNAMAKEIVNEVIILFSSHHYDICFYLFNLIYLD
jgi:hypothetical protein